MHEWFEFLGMVQYWNLTGICQMMTLSPFGSTPYRSIFRMADRVTAPAFSPTVDTKFTRRSELIKKIYADAGLMRYGQRPHSNILSLPTRDALVQRGAPALGRRIYVPGRRRAFRIGGGRSGVRCKR